MCVCVCVCFFKKKLGEFGTLQYASLEKEDIELRKSLLTKSHLELQSKNGNNPNTQQQINEELQEKLINIAPKTHCHHTMAIRQIEMSPHFPDICLTVADWTFCIWNITLENPLLFQSPFAPTYLTCGTWSPSRPGVIITAKIDGTVDVLSSCKFIVYISVQKIHTDYKCKMNEN